jgi:hypothetical protein
VSPLTQFSDQEYPNVRIEKRGDKILTVNSKAFAIGLLDESVIKKIVYTENVLVTDKQGKSTLYFLDYGARELPKNFGDPDFIHLKTPKKALTQFLHKIVGSKFSLFSLLKNTL